MSFIKKSMSKVKFTLTAVSGEVRKEVTRLILSATFFWFR